jgi:SAM-dependent methyltransferase
VVNQVLEHLKNIWLPLAEMYRVLRRGGLLIASVPNLGSLHNRVLLALGVQPTSIRVRGPHVRGYTVREFRNLLALDGALEVVAVRGVGFHPLPPRVARPLASVWAGASHTPVYVARKVAERRPDPWSAYRMAEDAAGVQTAYGALDGEAARTHGSCAGAQPERAPAEGGAGRVSLVP